MNTSRFGLSLLGAASTFAMTLALAGAAHAQDDGAVEEVVVTGTRLPAGLTAPTPVSTVSAASIAQKAPAQIIEALHDIPAFKQDQGVSQSQRNGSPLATVNLRGLGNVRTLVLVNGMRQVGTETQIFDTNRIPSNLVERVEVVTGGASAAYGSDAVAGAVNFLINDSLEGGRMDAQVGATQVGDNENYTLGFAYGRSFADGRGHFIFGTEYSRAQGTGTIYSRDWGRLEPGILAPSAAQRTAMGLPANLYANGVEFLATGLNQGIITSTSLAGTAFNPDGSSYQVPVGLQIGAPAGGNALSNLMIGTGNYGLTALGTFYLAMPLKRSATMARATFDITDSVSAFADFSYTYNYGKGITGHSQIPNGIMSSFVVLASNPYIPADVRARMTAAGITQFNLGLLPVAVAGNSQGNTGFEQDNAAWTQQTNVGLRGEIGETWKWDASWSHGWYHNARRYHQLLNSANLAAATYAIAGPNGQPICGPVATNPNVNATNRALILDGCSPMNPFVMSQSPEAIRYISTPTRGTTKNRQDSFAVNISGSLFDLWAGPVVVAAGGEYRKDKLSNVGEGMDARSFATGGTTTYSGARDVKEGYLEIGVPLLRDAPFAQALDFNAAARRTSYELSGAVTTYKVGATWDVMDGLRFRATQSRDIRAPNLNELFLVGNPGTNQGIRNPFNGQVGPLQVRNSGNRDLTPEIAQTFTGGVVLRPTLPVLERFTVTADYYWIKIKDVIASVSGAETLNRCFAGVQSYCSAITFDNSGYGISIVETRVYNQNQLRAKGVDLDIGFDVPTEEIGVPGSLQIHALGGYQPTLTTVDGAGISLNTAGSSLGVPEWHWVFNFDYSIGNLKTQLQANYFNEVLSNPSFIGPDDPRYEAIKTTASNTVNKNLFPSMVYWNLTAQYQINENFQVFGVVNNLLDKQPPDLAMIGMTGVDGRFNPYDPLGRAFRIGVRGNF